MLDQSPERWANFQRRVEELQATAPPGVQYKVFFLGRHGQGWHNFCSDKYGVEVSHPSVPPLSHLLRPHCLLFLRPLLRRPMFLLLFLEA